MICFGHVCVFAKGILDWIYVYNKLALELVALVILVTYSRNFNVQVINNYVLGVAVIQIFKHLNDWFIILTVTVI